MSKKSDRQYPLAKSYTGRHGRLRWRVRRKGVSIELGANYGTEDFVRRYADAVARLNAPREAGKSRVKPGTMRALAVEVYKSPEFRSCTAETQHNNNLIMEPFLRRHGQSLT